jgi:hypothetical protein
MLDIKLQLAGWLKRKAELLTAANFKYWYLDWHRHGIEVFSR